MAFLANNNSHIFELGKSIINLLLTMVDRYIRSRCHIMSISFSPRQMPSDAAEMFMKNAGSVEFPGGVSHYWQNRFLLKTLRRQQ